MSLAKEIEDRYEIIKESLADGIMALIREYVIKDNNSSSKSEDTKDIIADLLLKDEDTDEDTYSLFDDILNKNGEYSQEEMQAVYDIYIRTINHKNIDMAELYERFYNEADENGFNKIYALLIQELERRTSAELEEGKASSATVMYYYQLLYELIQARYKILMNDSEYNAEKLTDFKDKTRDDIFKYSFITKRYDHMVRVFFKDEKTKNDPQAFLEMYERIMQKAYFPTLDITKAANLFFERNMSDTARIAIRYGIKAVKWSIDEYKTFLELSQRNEIDVALAFAIIEKEKKKSPELDELFNKFIENNKESFAIWCLSNRSYERYLELKNGIACGKAKYSGPYFEIEYTENDIEMFRRFIDELMLRQKDKQLRYIDVEGLNGGGFSIVNKVGEYIIKTGIERNNVKIPNHRLILQPIIRMKNENAFFEVCDAVDTSKSTKEDADKIFDEMLEDGYAWNDPDASNVGTLLRPNYARTGIEKKIETDEGTKYIEDTSGPGEVATNMVGDSVDILPPGEKVIIDTDVVYDLRNVKSLDEIGFNYERMTEDQIRRVKEKFYELHGIKKQDYEEGHKDTSGDIPEEGVDIERR